MFTENHELNNKLDDKPSLYGNHILNNSLSK